MEPTLSKPKNVEQLDAEAGSSATTCSPVELRREKQRGYAQGYASGRKSMMEEIEGEHILYLKEGGVLILRGVEEITTAELERARGWLGTQLMIKENAKVNPAPDEKL